MCSSSCELYFRFLKRKLASVRAKMMVAMTSDYVPRWSCYDLCLLHTYVQRSRNVCVCAHNQGMYVCVHIIKECMCACT